MKYNNLYKFATKYIRDSYLSFVFLSITILVSILLKVYNPIIIKNLIDLLGMSHFDVNFGTVIFKYFCVMILVNVLSIISKYISENIGWKSTNKLRAEILTALFKKPISFFDNKEIGLMIERIDGDASILKNFYSKMILIVFNNVLLIVGICIVLFRENVLMGAFIVLYIIITGVVFIKIQSIAVPHWKAIRKASSRMYGEVSEYLDNREDIRNNNATNYILKKFKTTLLEWLPLRKKAIVMGYSTYIVTIILVGLGNTLSFLIGFLLWKKGLISVGTIYLFFTYTSTLAKPIDDIREQFVDLQIVEATIQRIDRLLNNENDDYVGKFKTGLEKIAKIEIDDLSFSYNKSNTVLDNICFEVNCNENIGIVGETGCGKSTLTKLIANFYKDYHGTIKINGIPNTEFDNEYFREKISYVSQLNTTFNASIRNNITLFDDLADDSVVIDSLNKVGLIKWYEQQENGLDTNIRDIDMSEGEVQLLSLARVFITNPSILIFDEPTSKLDAITEEKINFALNNLLVDRIGIIVSHKISTLRNVNKLLEFNAEKNYKITNVNFIDD